MKIVDYDTFIKMPAGTLYAEYTPYVFGETLIKQNTINGGKDWLYLELVGNPDVDSEWHIGCEAMEEGEELPPDTSLCRDGMFDYSRRFLVYSRDDVENMILTLKETLK